MSAGVMTCPIWVEDLTTTFGVDGPRVGLESASVVRDEIVEGNAAVGGLSEVPAAEVPAAGGSAAGGRTVGRLERGAASAIRPERPGVAADGGADTSALLPPRGVAHSAAIVRRKSSMPASFLLLSVARELDSRVRTTSVSSRARERARSWEQTMTVRPAPL